MSLSGAAIKAVLSLDGKGFERDLLKAVSFAKEQATGIKQALLIGMGAATIDQMIRSTLDFVVNTKRSSDELGVSLDRAVQLNRVMHAIGKNSSDLVGSLQHVQQYMGEAYYDALKMSRLSRLGITAEDFKNFDFDAVLQKALKTTKGMSMTVSQMLMDQVFGKVGIDLLQRRDQILASPEATGLTEAQIRESQEMVAKFKELKDTLAMTVIPALNKFAELLNSITKENKEVEQTYEERLARAFVVAPQMGVQTPSMDVQNRAEDSMRLKQTFRGLMTAWKGGLSKQSKEALINDAISEMFGPEVLKEVLKQGGLPGGSRESRRREGSPILPMYQALNEMSGNPFLRIGGLAGVDVSYRMERLLTQIADNTAAIARNTSVTNTPTPPTETSLPSPISSTRPMPFGGPLGASHIPESSPNQQLSRMMSNSAASSYRGASIGPR
jgi:hypothetical protein